MLKMIFSSSHHEQRLYPYLNTSVSKLNRYSDIIPYADTIVNYENTD